MSLTPGEINQLNIDLATHQGKINAAVDSQSKHVFFAFGIYDAPSEQTELNSFEIYWELEIEIQKSLNKIQKIKEKLR